MLTRSQVASVLPRGQGARFPRPRWSVLVRRITLARHRSLRMQDRLEATRSRCLEEHVYRYR